MKKRFAVCMAVLLCIGGCGQSAGVLEGVVGTSENAVSETAGMAESQSSVPETEPAKKVEGELVSMEEARADAQRAEESLKNGEYENLAGDIQVNFPDMEMIPEIDLRVNDRYWDCSLKDFVEAAKNLFGKYRPCSDENLIIDYQEQLTAADLKDEIEAGNSPYESKGVILYDGGGLRGGEMQMYRGRCSTWINRGEIAALTDEIGGNPCIHGYEGEFYDLRNGIPDVSLELSGEEVSIAEAIEVFNREMNEGYYFDDPNPDITLQVQGIASCRITDEAEAWKMYVGKAYKEIPLDMLYGGNSHVMEIKGFGGYFPESYLGMPAAMMLHKDYLDCAADCDRNYDVEEGKEIRKILPLTSALESLSGMLTGNTGFQVLSAEVTYISPQQFDENGEHIVSEETAACHYYPVWKIILGNPNDTTRQNYCVNLATGEILAYQEY